MIKLGSPPPVWGKERRKRQKKHTTRITPTRVGKSSDDQHTIRIYEDHPHPCGEKQAFKPIGARSGGSPPPVWGKEFYLADRVLYDGITPTRVGKSKHLNQSAHGQEDHPHPCGEKRSEREYIRCGYRITPTRVGKRKRKCWPPVLSGDHPHPCGEKSLVHGL